MGAAASPTCGAGASGASAAAGAAVRRLACVGCSAAALALRAVQSGVCCWPCRVECVVVHAKWSSPPSPGCSHPHPAASCAPLHPAPCSYALWLDADLTSSLLLNTSLPGPDSTLPPPNPPPCSYALWLDADLTRGLSRNCTTFGNSSLAGQEEFEVGAVELWGLS